MIYSMTGYGKDSAECTGYSVEVEVNSLNSRYLDLRFKIPPYLSSIEHRLRTLVIEKINRGKVSIFINLIPTGPEFKTSRIDIHTAERFYNEISELNNRLGISGEIDINTLMNIPDVIVTSYTNEEIESIYFEIAMVLERALDELRISREKEGEMLSSDIRSRISIIKSAIESIEKLIPGNNERQFEKLKVKLVSIVGDIQIDQSRLILEAGILAERYDITEELVRLKSHLNNFSIDLKNGGNVGKKLSFIIQEMGREANTIGAKCNDMGISSLVINIKEELEKIREQIANIE